MAIYDKVRVVQLEVAPKNVSRTTAWILVRSLTDAGNPHVRFDEREMETEHRAAIEASPDEMGGNR